MKLAKFLKYSSIILFLVIIVVALSVAAFIYFFPKETLRGIIVQTLTNALLRPVEIKSIDYSITGIQITDFLIYDVDKTKPPIVYAKQAAIRFELFPLLHKQFIINYISLHDAIVTIMYIREGTEFVSNIEKLVKELLESPPSAITTEIKSMSLTNATIVLENPPPVLKPLEGKYVISTDMEIENQKLVLRNVSIDLPLKRGTITGRIEVSLKDHFTIEGDYVLSNCDLLWIYKWGTNLESVLPYRVFTGTIKNCIITPHSVQGRVTGSCVLANKSILFVTNGLCNVNIPKEMVSLSNVKSKIDNSQFVIQQLLFNFNGDIISIKITDASVHIGEIAPLLGTISLKDISGKVEGAFEYKNKKVDANVTLYDLAVGKKEKYIIVNSVTLFIKNNQFKKDAIPVTLCSIPCVISIATADESFSQFIVNLEANEVNLDTINVLKGDSKKSTTIPYEFSGKIIIQRLIKNNNPIIEKLQCSYVMKGNSIVLAPFTAKVFYGDITGRCTINLTDTNPTIGLMAQFSNARLQNIASYITGFENRLFGNVSGKLHISMVAKDPIIDRISGKVELSVENGKLANTGLQNGLSVWIQDLKYKLSNLEFQKIYGNFVINGPEISINSFIFNSPDIRLKLHGLYHRYDTSDVDILLEFSSNFIQDLPNPALLQLAKYKKGRWYTIPFKAVGKDIFDGKNIKQVQ